ncbi:MAG: hypothetical protein ACRDGN_01545 [bacterium]
MNSRPTARAWTNRSSAYRVGWDATPAFDRLYARLNARYAKVVGRPFEDPLSPGEAELAAAIRRLAGLFNVPCSAGRPRKPAPVWADDPELYETSGEHVPAYLGAGLQPPRRMTIRPDVARAVRADGSLPEHRSR